jgi:hypothetical protein
MILQLFRWWYGPGWILAFRRINVRTANVTHAFSAGTLLKTLFAPWKRIQYTGRSFDDKMHAIGDNLISRVVGFTVRMGVLIAAAVMIIGSFVLGVFIAVVWPLVPLLIAYCVYRGIF